MTMSVDVNVGAMAVVHIGYHWTHLLFLNLLINTILNFDNKIHKKLDIKIKNNFKKGNKKDI